MDNFASGANDWYLGRIVVPIKQIQDKLYTGGHDSDVYAYYSGVLHQKHYKPTSAALSANCWQKWIHQVWHKGSTMQCVIAKGKERGENDAYISQGSEMLLKACTGQ